MSEVHCKLFSFEWKSHPTALFSDQLVRQFHAGGSGAPSVKVLRGLSTEASENHDTGTKILLVSNCLNCEILCSFPSFQTYESLAYFDDIESWLKLSKLTPEAKYRAYWLIAGNHDDAHVTSPRSVSA